MSDEFSSLSLVRVQSKDKNSIILDCWKNYSDKEAFIFSETEGTPHNTITPITRMKGSLFEMDLVLRNNITTAEKPCGVYHSEERFDIS